jgi:hypothetical protein
VFDIDVTRSWESNTTFPIRSIALPYLVVGLPYSFLKYVAPFISSWFNISVRTPYMLLMLPRLFACLLSFVSDYSMYGICRLYSQNYRARLLTLASSYVTLVYGTRTFSNTTEIALNSLLLYVVAYCMRHSDQVRTTANHILALPIQMVALILVLCFVANLKQSVYTQSSFLVELFCHVCIGHCLPVPKAEVQFSIYFS